MRERFRRQDVRDAEWASPSLLTSAAFRLVVTICALALSCISGVGPGAFGAMIAARGIECVDRPAYSAVPWFVVPDSCGAAPMFDGRFPSILLFGAPGVGKGTQGAVLGHVPGFYHLACGDVFRSLNMNSPEGREIYEYSSRGALVPDELTIRIWKKALHGQIAISRYKPPDEFLILDGIPRNPRQVEIIRDTINVLHVIHLVCADEEAMIDRIKRRSIRENRSDDANEEVIRTRFEIYRQESEPVINCYPQEITSRIDAMRSPAEVLNAILTVLIPIQNQWRQNLPDDPL
jgi:adenylate kinase